MAIKPQPVKITKPTIIGKKAISERISESLNKKVSLTKPQFELIVNEMLTQIKLSLVKGEEVRLSGYFSLKTVITKPRVAMNLQTKKKMNVPAKRVPKAKFSVDLKEAIAKKK
jgi:DNA-binding protein HU-beta